MSFIKTDSNLFLGLQEINRLKSFLDDLGWRKYISEITSSFGLVNISKAGAFDNGKIEVGTSSGTIKINPTFIIDSDFNFVKQDTILDNIPITAGGAYYWIRVFYTASNAEVGTVTISTNGSLVGTGTEFLALFRGKSRFPVKIKFLNSALGNNGVYTVTDVIDDTNAILSGNFTAESGLKYVILGTHTPGVSVPTDGIYQYDGLSYEIVAESVTNTRPTYTPGQKFYLARVKNVAGTVTVEDKRTDIYSIKGEYLLNEDYLTVQNPLIGPESVQFMHDNNTNRNRINFAWTFRTTNWTVNSNLNQITIIAGNGGKYKSTSDFTTGQFNGWLVYFQNGKSSVIRSSTLNTTQINLVLDTLDVDNLTAGDELIIAPNAEEIEVWFYHTTQKLVEKRQSFPINKGYATMELDMFSDPCSYIMQYRYKNFKKYSTWFLIPSDSVGYYTEASFDANGVLVGSPTRHAYTASLVTPFILFDRHA